MGKKKVVKRTKVAKLVEPVIAAVKAGVAGSCKGVEVVGSGCALDTNHAGKHVLVVAVPVK